MPGAPDAPPDAPSPPLGSPPRPPTGLRFGEDELIAPSSEYVGQVKETPPAPVRPFDALLKDPLSEVARKERRSLLGISIIAVLIGHTSLIPQKIESLGVTFEVSTQRTILRVLTAMVIYYTLAFVVYVAGDALTLFREIHRRVEEVKARRLRLAAEGDSLNTPQS